MAMINRSYNDMKKHVLSEYYKFEELLKEFDMGIDESLYATAKKIENSIFNLVVLGEAKSGKSTFINAYLGTEILPMSSLQCTSSIIEIKRGARWELYAYTATGARTIISGEEEIKKFLETTAAIDKNYNEIPVTTINNELIKVKGEFRSKDLEELLNRLKKDNFHKLSEEIYEEKIKQYIDTRKDSWEKIITRIEIFCPLIKEELGEISLVDSPGVGAEGNVGSITENFINKADAIVFVKSLLGQSLESTSFMKFLDTNITENNKKNLFLVFTGKADKNKNDFRELEEEARKLYAERIENNKIVFVDSLIELYLNRCKDITTSEEIDAYLSNLSEEGNYFKAIDNIWLRKSGLEKERFIDNLKEESCFDNVEEMLVKYAKTAKFNQLQDFLNSIYAESYKVIQRKKKNLEILNNEKKSIDQIKYELNEMAEKEADIVNKLKNTMADINNSYQGNLEEEGKIQKEVNILKENYKEEFEKNINEIVAELEEDKNVDPNRIFSELKKHVQNGLDKVEELKENLQKSFILECNKELINLQGQLDSTIYFTPTLSETDLDKIREESEKDAIKEIKGLFTFRKHETRFMREEFIEKIKTRILNKLDGEIIPKLQESLYSYINKTLEEYSRKLIAEKDQAKEITDKLSSELKTAEDKEKQKNILQSQIEEFEKLQKQVQEVLKEVKNYV